MTTITTRASKGAPLSWAEADANLTNLNNDKLEAADLAPYATTVAVNAAIASATTNMLETSDIGVSVQAYSPNLSEYAAVNPTTAGLALLDDVDAAAQRTTLGLGTVATLNVGTGANQIVQLNGSGELPAVSGANLTNLPAPVVTHDGEFRSVQVFTTTGANTYTKPSGLKRVKVMVVGAGGGGGGCASGGANASGGGGGGASIKYIEASAIGTTETVTIGAGGTAGTTGGSAGGTGGTSSFGAHCSATGGAGGNGTISGATLFERGGAGGTGASGTFNIRGQPGRGGTTNYSGVGGSSIFGGAGTAVQNAGGVAGFDNSGGGGSGANNLALTTGRAGGVGGTGVVFVEEFF